MRFGDDVLVLDRNHRNVEADHGACLPGEVSGRGDDVLAGNVALVSLHHPLAIRLLLNAGHGGVAVDLCPARTRALCHGLGEVGRLDVTIIRMLDGTEQAIRLAQRPDLLDLGGREHVHLDADRLGNAGIIHELVPPILGAGEAYVGDFLETDVLARFGFKRVIQLDRVFVNLTHRVGQVEQRQQARGVPGGARCQFLPLDQDDVAPALLREVVERADAHHATADDDHARM